MEKYFSHFLGAYNFERTVKNPDIKMTGAVVFKEIKQNHIESYEEGCYFLNNEKIDFFQKRYYIFEDSFLNILTADGTLLHILTEKNCSHTHECKNDLYHVTLKINDEGFETFYIITGPNKNISIHTVYER